MLLALRFDSQRPINGPADDQISNSIRVPRCLSKLDIGLLEKNVARSDRWSAFISYRQAEHLKLVQDFSEFLQLDGLSVFRDLDRLRGGSDGGRR